MVDNLSNIAELQVVEEFHPGRANVAKDDIAEKLAKNYKTRTNCIVLFGFKTQFGGGRSKGFAFIYDNEDLRNKYDSITKFTRNKKKVNHLFIIQYIFVQMGIEIKKTISRRQKKDIKHRQMEVHGTEKSKVQAGGKKK